MFQTFSGSSRRPRNVNLSGQNTNPFAASSWSPSVSSTQKTVAHAQQERLQRQQERDRLNASKRIQRTWRGHKARRDLADSRRHIWDSNTAEAKFLQSFEPLVEQVQLLVAFFNSRRRDDFERVALLSHRISVSGYSTFLALQDIQPQLVRLAKVALEALQGSLPKCEPTLLRLLIGIINQRPQTLLHISKPYYHFLSSLVASSSFGKLDRNLFLDSLRSPMVEHIGIDQNDEILLKTHAAFALQFLSTSNLEIILGTLDNLAAVPNISILSAALVREFSPSSVSEVDSASKLWLLAHFIALHRLQNRSTQEPDFIRALSMQLSSSSEEIVGRIDPVLVQESADSDDISPQATKVPLPPYIKNELSSLVNQVSISGLLARFNVDYVKASRAGEEDASLLASYALTLLRIFPQRGDDIRRWLYRGSMTTSLGLQIPALKFFWQAMRITNTFAVIVDDSKGALGILRPQKQSQFTSTADLSRDREWRTILLFLELYTFVLRFTDDEEFLSASTPNVGQVNGPISSWRESALPLEEVKRLTIFLKNLAFTMYYNASELSDDDQNIIEGGLGTYFGTNTTTARFQPSSKSDLKSKHVTNRPFAGISGMKFEYVRTIVTRVMRMLYERNSRRPFLPKDHWLMTSRFDMEGFIPSVVLEEERQHQVREEGEEEDPEDLRAVDERNSLIGMSRPRRAQALEALRKQQQKAQRKKMLAAVGPRLEVLQNMPFVIPFETRVQIFRQFVLLDQTRRRDGNVDPDTWRMSIVQQAMAQGMNRNMGREVLGRHHAKIRRDHCFEDAYEQFYDLGEGLKEPIQITFVDQFDTAEAGIDGGGVTKEFLTSVTNEAFRPGEGAHLFTTNAQNLLYPNPAALDERREILRQAGLNESSIEWRETIGDLVRQFEFLGRIVGKCMYEGILVDIGFAGFFLLKWATSAASSGQELEYRANINDLRDLDEDLYQGLWKLKNYPGDVQDFALDFTITDTISPPGAPTRTITRNLIPNGSNISVTNENRVLYVYLVAQHRLVMQPKQQTQAFLRGLCEIINPSWLSMFNQSELQTLIGGDSSGINVEDLRSNTVYNGVYQIGDDGLEHPTIQIFWDVLKNLEDAERRKVLKYVTSTPRAPLLGFSQLNPRFTIRDAGSDEERLPSASTCVNLLKLPRYSTAPKLKAKLLYAVNSGAGFDLS